MNPIAQVEVRDVNVVCCQDCFVRSPKTGNFPKIPKVSTPNRFSEAARAMVQSVRRSKDLSNEQAASEKTPSK